MVAGFVIGLPTLRLRGDYLAIVTLAFGEIVRLTITNLQGLTNGPNGITGIYSPRLAGEALVNPAPRDGPRGSRSTSRSSTTTSCSSAWS